MAAVNGIVLSGIGDLTLAEALNSEYLELLADRRSLPQHPALMYQGRINDMKSNVVKVSHLGMRGYDVVSQVADGAIVPNTSLTDGSSTITVVRYSKSYSASDLAKIVRAGILDPAIFAADAAQSVAGRMVQLAADVVDGFTLTGGTTATDLDAADILAVLGTADINELVGPFMGMLHGRQWADLQLDLGTAIGGSLQFNAATAELVGFKGQAFKGSWLGADWFVYNRVNSDGTDRKGGLFGPGAVLWMDGAAPVEDPSQQMSINGDILFERVRDGKSGETAYVQHSYRGMSLGIQNGITIGSSAS
jgi:hypothetical protein